MNAATLQKEAERLIEVSASLPEDERKKMLLEVGSLVVGCNFEARKCAAEIELISEKKSNESKKRISPYLTSSSREVYGARR